MDNIIVFLIIALAAGYVIRRFFFKKSAGCGCSGGCPSPEKKNACCDNGQRLQ